MPHGQDSPAIVVGDYFETWSKFDHWQRGHPFRYDPAQEYGAAAKDFFYRLPLPPDVVDIRLPKF